jgi:hypothetical protein
VCASLSRVSHPPALSLSLSLHRHPYLCVPLNSCDNEQQVTHGWKRSQGNFDILIHRGRILLLNLNTKKKLEVIRSILRQLDEFCLHQKIADTLFRISSMTMQTHSFQFTPKCLVLTLCLRDCGTSKLFEYYGTSKLFGKGLTIFQESVL